MSFPHFLGGKPPVDHRPDSPTDLIKQASHTKTACNATGQNDALERLPQCGKHEEQAQNSHDNSHHHSNGLAACGTTLQFCGSCLFILTKEGQARHRVRALRAVGFEPAGINSALSSGVSTPEGQCCIFPQTVSTRYQVFEDRRNSLREE